MAADLSEFARVISGAWSDPFELRVMRYLESDPRDEECIARLLLRGLNTATNVLHNRWETHEMLLELLPCVSDGYMVAVEAWSRAILVHRATVVMSAGDRHQVLLDGKPALSFTHPVHFWRVHESAGFLSGWRVIEREQGSMGLMNGHSFHVVGEDGVEHTYRILAVWGDYVYYSRDGVDRYSRMTRLEFVRMVEHMDYDAG